MEEVNVKGFKIIPDAMAAFKALMKKHTSIRFTEEPAVDREYISLSFTMSQIEYLNLIDECVKERIYYYVA
jgi:hypothetical protein